MKALVLRTPACTSKTVGDIFTPLVYTQKTQYLPNADRTLVAMDEKLGDIEMNRTCQPRQETSQWYAE